MKTLDRQKLGVVKKTRSKIFGWCGPFTPESKPLEFERFGNYGEFAVIKSRAREPNSGSNPVEFDGIKSLGKRQFTRPTV